MYNIRLVEPYTTTRYLHQEDVVNYLMELAAGEETDVRERIEAAASILGSVCSKNAINNAPKNPLYKGKY